MSFRFGVVAVGCIALFHASAKADENLDAIRKKMQSPKIEVRCTAALEIGALGSAGAEAVPDLIEMLRSGDAKSIHAASRALTQIGRPAVPSLMLELESTGEVRRQVALMSLGAMGRDSGRASQAVARLLGNRDDGTRLAAALVLGAMHECAAPAVGAIGDAMADPDLKVRMVLADALFQIGPSALPTIRRVSRWSDPEIRSLMFSTLGRFKQSQEAAEYLQEGLKDESPAVRSVSASALLRLGKLKSSAHEGLLGALGSKDSEVQAIAFGSLVGLGAFDDEAKMKTICAFNEKSGWLQASAPRMTPEILAQAMGKNPSPMWRLTALLAASQYGGPPGTLMPPIKKAMSDPDRTIAGAASLAGACIDPKAIRDREKAAEHFHAAVKRIRGVSDVSETVRLHMAISVLASLEAQTTRLSRLSRERLSADQAEVANAIREWPFRFEDVPIFVDAINAAAQCNLGFTEPFATLAQALDQTLRKSRDERISAYVLANLGNGVADNSLLQPAMFQIWLHAIPRAPVKQLIAERIISIEQGKVMLQATEVRESALSYMDMGLT